MTKYPWHRWYLDGYSLFLKGLSIVTGFLSFVLMGLMIYAWGQITAVYTIARTFLGTLAQASPDVYGGLQLPPLPIWPLILFIVVVLVVGLMATLTLWAISSSIDLRLEVEEEERTARTQEKKLLEDMQGSLASVAQYFAALPQPKR